MEHKFSDNRLDLQALRELCEREGEMATYRRGEQLEREGDPAQWFGFVTEGCFKYVTRGISECRDHVSWFSFEGEFVGDYPACINGVCGHTSIEAMMPSRVFRVHGKQLTDFCSRDTETAELRATIAEHLLSQARARYLDFHRATPRERYELLLHRCPGIVELLDLQDIASFLNVTPKTISKIRKEITFGKE